MPADVVIAVTGATGAVGSRVARRLAGAGLPQRLIVRDAGRAPLLAGAEVRQVAGYAAGGEMRAALTGVDTLFLVPAAEAVDRVEQHRSAIDAAVAADVRRIVYLSFLGATPDSTFTLGRDHWATEEHIRGTAVAFTFLRMSLYTDFIPSMVGADGVIRGPAGEGRVAAILRDDVAAAAAGALTSVGHDGMSYDLTGPAAFTLAEAAGSLARATGEPIRFHDETEAEAYASRASSGAPGWEVRGWVTSYLAIRDGSLDHVGTGVRTLTGRDPVSLEEYLERRPEDVGPVTGGGAPVEPG